MALPLSAEAKPAALVVSYAPSWLDRMQTALERARIPSWAFYWSLWAGPYLAVTLIQWSTGALPIGVASAHHATLWGTAVFALALMHHLDGYAVRSLQAFRAALSIPEPDVERLVYRLTHLPAGKAAAVAALGVAVGTAEVLTLSADAVDGLGLFTSPAARVLEIGMYVLGWAFFLTLIYHSIHQLGVVGFIYRHCTRVNLFRLDPIYAFSWLTARTALGVAALPYAYFLVSTLTDPGQAQPHHALAVTGIVLVAVLVFAWPLRGIHRVLSGEKIRLLRESSIRLEAAILELHARADAKDYADMDGLNKLISSLTMEQAALDKISTWPWKPDTLRLFISALLLPLLAFVAQRVLAGAFGI